VRSRGFGHVALSVLVRHADPARDGAECAEIYAPFVRDSAVTFDVDPPDASEMAAQIEQIQATHPWLVAETDGRVAGYAYASPHRARAAYRWASDVTVYVGPNDRRRGVGRALYEWLFAQLTTRGYYVACAGITLPNDASVALHRSVGFEPVGVYRAIGWKAGDWRDVSWWQLRLREPDGDGPPPEPLRARP
jgi:L-amino acid N-acyltransferase YncA